MKKRLAPKKKPPKKIVRKAPKKPATAKKVAKPKLTLTTIVKALPKLDEEQLTILAEKLAQEREGRVDTHDFDEADWEAVTTKIRYDGEDRTSALRAIRRQKDEDARLTGSAPPDLDVKAATAEGDSETEEVLSEGSEDPTVIERATEETLALARAQAEPSTDATNPDDDTADPK